MTVAGRKRRSAAPEGAAFLFPGEGPYAGLDEAGRGPLAGPVAAAAVVLPEPVPPELAGLDDSKRLSPAQRSRLEPLIKAHALAWAVASASVAEIEAGNILQATFLAMRRAFACLSQRPSRAVVDGNADPGLGGGTATLCVVGGDALVPAVSAASILAKTARDRWMVELDGIYPGYGLARHKGYGGSVGHRDALRLLGPSPVHRLSFLGRILPPGGPR